MVLLLFMQSVHAPSPRVYANMYNGGGGEGGKGGLFTGNLTIEKVILNATLHIAGLTHWLNSFTPFPSFTA